METHERQLTRRLRIGVGHACGIAFVPGGNELDTGLHQTMRDLEIGSAKQTEAPAGAEVSKILCQG